MDKRYIEPEINVCKVISIRMICVSNDNDIPIDELPKDHVDSKFLNDIDFDIQDW